MSAPKPAPRDSVENMKAVLKQVTADSTVEANAVIAAADHAKKMWKRLAADPTVRVRTASSEALLAVVK